MGLVLANQDFAFVARIKVFQATIGTLVIATLFITLAATIELTQLRSVLLPSALLLLVLVLIARPLAAFASTVGSSLSPANRGFIGAVAPRGIVAASTVSFYAIRLNEKGLAADEIVPITFAVIIGAGIVYGFGSPAMAKVLKVGQGTPKGVALFMSQPDAHPIATELTRAGVSVLVVDDEERPGLITDELSYEMFGNGLEDEGLALALNDADVGTSVIAAGVGERDLVAMALVGAEMGTGNVFLIPNVAKDQASGIEAKWRRQTPDSRIPFGPDMTRSRLRELLAGAGDLTWISADASETQIPSGTVPLFIVDADGRATIASQKTVRALRNRRAGRDCTVLCVTPKNVGAALAG
jgi:hypothetical protein